VIGATANQEDVVDGLEADGRSLQLELGQERGRWHGIQANEAGQLHNDVSWE
jgi:hypothetical protein